eukprot:SAG31_NODE_85_length_26982_cov_19.325485_10_plen_215_part_00
MARKRQKAGVKGNAANYMTRNKAVKTLQLSLKDFRRLCILKGIYPREPRKKVHGHNKTYYLTKDIQFLSHEHIISKFREMKAFRKKMKRAVNKDMTRAVASLERNKPRYVLDHIVRERYPTFVDSVRDMDDALCLVHLIARFPSTSDMNQKRVRDCARLAREFQQYAMLRRRLRRVFVSVKGIYYQVDIANQPVTWVVPHNTGAQYVPTDVDLK